MQDPPHPSGGDLDVVAAPETHRDPRRAKALIRTQMHDPLDHLRLGRGGAVMRFGASVTQPLGVQLVKLIAPLVEHRSTDAVATTGRCDVARDLPGMAKHHQAIPDLAVLLSTVRGMFLSRDTPNANKRPHFQT